jgi:iron complex outermembrane receptor protein
MMFSNRRRTQLLGSAALLGVVLLAGVAEAQTAAQPAEIGEVVVTGSRIRRTDTETSAPVNVVGQQDILDRGYTQIGEALNRLTSVAPMQPATPGNGAVSGSGQQFPNLFNLGAGRTLTLVNGRRMVTSSSAFPTAAGVAGDRVVDTNIIPTGLIQRVDVVQAGGAAVYGSDAIAGVINYVLKDDFQGVTVDLQYGDSSRNDYKRPSVRVTAGTNFAGGRGNIAGDIEYSKTEPLAFGSRPITQPVIRTLSNPNNKTLTDGIPSITPVTDPHFWAFNTNGVLFSNGNTFSIASLLGFKATGDQISGFQFSPDGQSVIPYNAGTRYASGFNCSFPFCNGGEGYPYSGLTSLYSGVETYSLTGIGHYDITEHMKISGELLYARTEGRDPRGLQAPSTTEDFVVTNSNPYLTSGAKATLTSLFPAFATGTPLFYGKNFEDLLPTREYTYSTDTYRGVVSLDGDFDLAGRSYYYSAFYSRSVVKGRQNSYDVYQTRLSNALDATRNAAGQIVCAINAVTVTDAQCAPINPFGNGNVSAAARAYVSVPTDVIYNNTQDDFLASLGGDVVQLPGGMSKFNVSYEHREETAKNTPSTAAQLGLILGGAVPPTSGSFKTNELAGELLVPVVGGDFTLPFVQAFELSAQGRVVDNSLAGKETVWGLGGRWEVGGGLTLRASRSRNFRAPTLTQLLAPRITAEGQTVQDACDGRSLNSGPNPTVRVANCLALFTANAGYGLGTLPAGVANTPQNRLSNFQQPAFNDGSNTLTTTGGNPNLSNEISKTTTFGFVWQPKYIPGSLTVVADRVIVDLKNGITAFTGTNFNNACYDAASPPADICSTFTRNSTGTIISALSTTYNAAAVRYRGEVYTVNYRFPLSWVLPMFDDPGSLEISEEATHNENLKTLVAGATTQQAGTVLSPRWVSRTELRYRRGPLSASYELYYLPETKVNVFDTIENSPYPNVKANARHSISATYDFMDRYQVRGGVNNITDRGPSFPTFNYGDLIGRQWFVGLRASF